MPEDEFRRVDHDVKHDRRINDLDVFTLVLQSGSLPRWNCCGAGEGEKITCFRLWTCLQAVSTFWYVSIKVRLYLYGEGGICAWVIWSGVRNGVVQFCSDSWPVGVDNIILCLVFIHQNRNLPALFQTIMFTPGCPFARSDIDVTATSI